VFPAVHIKCVIAMTRSPQILRLIRSISLTLDLMVIPPRLSFPNLDGKMSLWYTSRCVSYNNVNRAVYTSIISTNKNKSILTYQHSFIGQRCFATCFDLHKVIIRRIYKNSVLVLELCFLIWFYIITIYFILIANTTFLLNII
jgi:hypothetical protein